MILGDRGEKSVSSLQIHSALNFETSEPKASSGGIGTERSYVGDRSICGQPGGSSARSSSSSAGKDGSGHGPEMGISTRQTGPTTAYSKSVRGKGLTPRQIDAEHLLRKLSMIPDDIYDSDEAADQSQRTMDVRRAEKILEHRRQKAPRQPRSGLHHQEHEKKAKQQ